MRINRNIIYISINLFIAMHVELTAVCAFGLFCCHQSGSSKFSLVSLGGIITLVSSSDIISLSCQNTQPPTFIHYVSPDPPLLNTGHKLYSFGNVLWNVCS